MRLSKEQLQKVKDNYGVDRLWSWSMVNTFMTSPYEYYLKYVKRIPEDLQNCVYGTMGTIAHNTLEKLYNNEIEFDKLDEEFSDGWLSAVTISDLKFDRNDEEHNKKLADSYYANLKHFFSHHNVIPYKVLTERFVTTKINDYVLQGYIDAVFTDNDNNYNIIDFKTSSIFKGKTLDEHSGQLTVYALGLIQVGIPIDRIKIAFNFLKYVTIEYSQKNGTIKTRDVERSKIGEALQSNTKMWLKANNYSEKEIEDYLKQLLDENSISVLPVEIQKKYMITDCYVYIPLTEQLIERWKDTITLNIKDILTREKDYQESDNDKCFYDTEENVKAQSYYFATLSGYSANLHKPYKDYLDKLEASKNGGDMFGGVGNGIEETVNTKTSNSIDLSWLDEI